MIKDRTVPEIRAWVGEQAYSRAMKLRDPGLYNFLNWLEVHVPPRKQLHQWDFSWMKIRDASDDQVMQWYLQFLLDGGNYD